MKPFVANVDLISTSSIPRLQQRAKQLPAHQAINSLEASAGTILDPSHDVSCLETFVSQTPGRSERDAKRLTCEPASPKDHHVNHRVLEIAKPLMQATPPHLVCMMQGDEMTVQRALLREKPCFKLILERLVESPARSACQRLATRAATRSGSPHFYHLGPADPLSLEW